MTKVLREAAQQALEAFESHGTEGATEQHTPDPYAATRRAIVRAAAEIGKEMK